MTSTKPYLIRAIYEWLLDNSLTPYLMVDVDHEGVKVPEDQVEDGQIILDLSPDVIRSLEMTNKAVEFYAQFSRVKHHLYIPVSAVVALYAYENGRGMVFTDEHDEDDDSGTIGDSPGDTQDQKKKGPPHLKIVK